MDGQPTRRRVVGRRYADNVKPVKTASRRTHYPNPAHLTKRRAWFRGSGGVPAEEAVFHSGLGNTHATSHP